MNPATLALISQAILTATQVVLAVSQTRQQLGANATQQEQQNLDQAEANFQAVIDAATKVLIPAASAGVPKS